MRYSIGKFVVFTKIVQRYTRHYADEQHKIAYISPLKEPFPVGQITGFKHLKFGVSKYDCDDGYSFAHFLTVPCYEVKIGVLNKPYYVREKDLSLYNTNYSNHRIPVNIDSKLVCIHKCECNNQGNMWSLKMKVMPDKIVILKSNQWDKGRLNDDDFIYEED